MGRVLVTGAAGFIGSHVADALLARGHEVCALDDLSGGFRENVPAAAEFVHGSIADPDFVDRVFAGRPITHVYHLAAYAAEGLSHFIKRFNYTNNVIGSVNLLNAAIRHEVEQFVFSSSIAVYGATSALPLSEATVPSPDDSYGIAKYAIELELHACRRMFGLDSIVFRPHNVFGPRQNIGDPYRNVIGIFMNQLLQGQPMTIFGDGTQTRAFTYVDDVAPLMAEAIDVPAARNGTFNVGADRVCSLNDLAHMVAAAMNVAPAIVHLPPRIEATHLDAEHGEVRRVFGDREPTPLQDGLDAMAAWVRSHGARRSVPFEGIEVLKNLPAAWRRGP